MQIKIRQDEAEPYGVVAVGGSAGSIEALKQVVVDLPADLPLAVLVAVHMPHGAESVLARILDRSGPLPAVTATDGEPLRPGRIYVAVPGYHLLVQHSRLVLSHGPTEDGHRPAINALFRSVAVTFNRRAVGVLLSGVLDDGVLGLAAIRHLGGVTVAQDPDDALFSAMPQRAVEAGVVDHRVPAADVGKLLVELAGREVAATPAEPDARLEMENRIALGPAYAAAAETEALGPPSGYTCPDCNGSLMAAGESSYRCRIGHAWTSDALLHARDNEIQNALGIALRSLQEKARLSRKLAAGVASGALQKRYTELAEETERAAAVLGDRMAEAYLETNGLRDEG